MRADFNNIEEFITALRVSGKLKPETYEPSDLNKGPLNGVDCPECGNTGHIHFEQNGYLFSKPCKCLKTRHSLLNIKKSGLADLLEEYTFKSYSTPDDKTRRIKEAAARYVQQGERSWFYISGKPGSGKTHICTAICSALLKRGISVKYVLWRDIAQKLKSVVNEPEFEEIMDELRRPEILYIDDFMKGTVSDADCNRAFEILNARYNSPKKRTIISSERDISEIRFLDEATGGRIYQRSKGYCFKAPDINWRN